MRQENKRLAVLIDADNAQASIISDLLAEISKYGVSSVKRAYGDWTSSALKGWKEHLHKHAIRPIQQFSYTKGKNSTDSSLIIDAMDLLHKGDLDGFCIVSSDSDFTSLANRIREDGLIMYGFGEKKTPEPFVVACDKFIYTEILKNGNKEGKNESNNTELKDIISNAIGAVMDDSGWATLAAVGSYINKKSPAFDSRSYGYEKLGKLIESLDYVEVKPRNDESGNTHIYIKARK